MTTIAIHEWLLADGTSMGCGSVAEFQHWQGQGVIEADSRLGKVIGNEPASEDDRRAAAWAKEAA